VARSGVFTEGASSEGGPSSCCTLSRSSATPTPPGSDASRAGWRAPGTIVEDQFARRGLRGARGPDRPLSRSPMDGLIGAIRDATPASLRPQEPRAHEPAAHLMPLRLAAQSAIGATRAHQPAADPPLCRPRRAGEGRPVTAPGSSGAGTAPATACSWRLRSCCRPALRRRRSRSHVPEPQRRVRSGARWRAVLGAPRAPRIPRRGQLEAAAARASRRSVAWTPS
jgi:hypothetical protein